MRWSCPKTFHQKTINFFIDYKDYKMCFYHALAVYFMTANGTERAAQYHRGYEFIFPQLAKQNIAGVHWTITMWIQSMSRTSTTRNFPAKVHITLPGDMTGKSLRKGAINMLHTRNMPVLTHRSGHSVVPRGFEGNRAYNYVDESLPEVEEGGRLLAGKDFHDNDAIPSLAVVKASLSVEQNKGLQAFIMDLFQTHANPRFGPELAVPVQGYVSLYSILHNNLSLSVITYHCVPLSLIYHHLPPIICSASPHRTRIGGWTIVAMHGADFR
jgi:hypothetical protein